MKRIATLVIAIVLFAGAAGAIDIELESLRDLPGVCVLIPPFTSDSRSAGFRKAAFKTAAELKLRLAGIKVLTKDECFKTPGIPTLLVIVTVHTMATGEQNVAPYSMRLELMQLATLKRNGKKTVATTWSTRNFGLARASEALEIFEKEMDIFLNAWLTVNPRP